MLHEIGSAGCKFPGKGKDITGQPLTATSLSFSWFVLNELPPHDRREGGIFPGFLVAELAIGPCFCLAEEVGLSDDVFGVEPRGGW